VNFDNSYEAYVVGSVDSLTPMSLVVKLYEGAISSLSQAQAFLESGDILGRGDAVNRAINILMELLSSLDYERGAEVSKSLGALYCYVQNRIVEGHLKQTAGPLQEAADLMRNVLGGWRQAEKDMAGQAPPAAAVTYQSEPIPHEAEAQLYGYFAGAADGVSTMSARF
jgi:flagellar protein FliS